MNNIFSINLYYPFVRVNGSGKIPGAWSAVSPAGDRSREKGPDMIASLNDFSRLAREKGPKEMAVLAPEDEEFMRAVRISREHGYIEPILIVPCLDTGYLLAQALVFIGRMQTAGIVAGASRPVILNLPFVSPENRIVEIALACLLCEGGGANG